MSIVSVFASVQRMCPPTIGPNTAAIFNSHQAQHRE